MAKTHRYKMCNQIIIAFLICLKLSIPMVECTLKYSCKDISGKSMELQLKTHLFCDYDSKVRPHTKTNNVTKVTIQTTSQIIEFEEETNTFSMHSRTRMNWTDPYLTWNPKDFNGTDKLTVPSTDIWTPDLLVYNSGASGEDNLGIPKTNCIIRSYGKVVCIPTVKYVTHCDTDYRNYPYDYLNCSIELVTWGYSSEEVAITMPSVIIPSPSPHKDWRIKDLRIRTKKTGISNLVTSFKNESFVMDTYSVLFVLKRQNKIMQTIYIAPLYTLTVLTLCVLWFDCHSKERMILSCLCFISHLLFMQDFCAFIPHNGAVSPYILQFYKSSFIVITLVMILTVLQRKLQRLTTPAPGWVTSSTLFILQSRVGQLLMLSILDPKASAFLESSADDNDDLMHAKKKDSTWKYVSLLIGWLMFISVFLVYMVLLALYLPVPKYN